MQVDRDERQEIVVARIESDRDERQEIVVARIESELNDFMDDYGLTNDDLKQILQQIIVDIDRGFVGEPC